MNDYLNPRSILRGQIQALEQQMNQIEHRLEDAKEIEPDLYERVRIRFANEIESHRSALGDIWKKIDRSPDYYANWWDDFRKVRDGCTDLFRECLAFLGGALVRRAQLDEGLCQIADALLYELADRTEFVWNRFTILADGEFYSDMAEIVRIRFPEMSIWNLPVAAHEFGHYAGPRLELREDGSRPFRDLLNQEREKGERKSKEQGQRNWSYLHERFADLFAVYTLGPAYACTCLLLRFDPRTAYKDWDYHPSDAQRAHWILRALGRIGNARSLPTFLDDVIKRLAPAWRQSLVANSQKAGLDQTVTKSLDTLMSKLYGWLDTRPDARFGREAWYRAESLSHELRKRVDESQSKLPSLNDQDTLVDILNAAWHWRVYHWDGENIYALHDIGDIVFKLCLESINRKTKGV